MLYEAKQEHYDSIVDRKPVEIPVDAIGVTFVHNGGGDFTIWYLVPSKNSPVEPENNQYPFGKANIGFRMKVK